MPQMPPTIAVDLRALVPAPTGIGVYTRSLLLGLAARGGLRYLGMAHRPPREAGELEAAGIDIETQETPLGVLWQQLRLPRRLARGDVDLFWSPLITLPVRCPVPEAAAKMEALINEVRKDRDSIGGICELIATGVPLVLSM